MRYPKLLPLKSFEELEVEFHRRNKRTLRVCPVLLVFIAFFATIIYASVVMTDSGDGQGGGRNEAPDQHSQ